MDRKDGMNASEEVLKKAGIVEDYDSDTETDDFDEMFFKVETVDVSSIGDALDFIKKSFFFAPIRVWVEGKVYAMCPEGKELPYPETHFKTQII